MRHHRELFENVRRRTGMYLHPETYASVAGFVCGYDAAYARGVLAARREWLAMRRDTGSNLGWSAPALHAAFPKAPSPQEAPLAGPEAERQAIDTLFDLIAEFDEVRAKRDGLNEIFLAY